MNARVRFAIALGVLGLLMTGPFLLTAALVVADGKGQARQILLELTQAWLPLGGILTLLGFVLGAALLRHLFRQYVLGLLRMAEHLRLMLEANRDFRVALAGPPEVCELARAANDLAQQRDELLRDVDARVAQAKISVEAEKNRLAALMSELALGVVVCNLDGRILLYNNRARLQFKAMAQGQPGGVGGVGGGNLIGLGRSIFTVMERAQITHALENVERRVARGAAEPATNFITVTRSGQLLRVQMAPVRAAESEAATASAQETPATPATLGGFVLTLKNITQSFEREARRDQLLNNLTEGGRAGLGALRAAVETLHADPALDAAERRRLVTLVRDEATRMQQRLEEVSTGFADVLKTRWPLEDMLGVDLIAAAQRRIAERVKLPTKIETLDETLWLRADSFLLLQAMTFLAARLADHYEIRELRFRLSSEGDAAHVDLIWSGQPMSAETIHTWELEPMNIGAENNPLTLRDVINRHGGELLYQREKAAHRAFFRLALPLAAAPSNATAPAEQSAASGSRPEYYDFNLFAARDASIDLDRKLTELAYTVFDTETTGLEPSKGDEIIQIGAVRIINGRLLRQETFDQLIDPRIPLKPEGIPIHGITEDMVRGQPTLEVVLPTFHEFCQDTALVAHNAAFDMRFLQVQEPRTGLQFSQPVLDTLLLSAVIHPNQESHKLESIAERLGITILGRHTALGDAFVTGEVFLRMVTLLNDMGILTLRQALAAAEKTYYARVKY